MIYFFYGNSDFLLSETTKKWKNQFVQKYWDFQLTHIRDYSDPSSLQLDQNITSGWLFAEKKLIIFDNIPGAGSVKDKNIIKIQEDLLKILPRKIESVIIVFSSLNPDKRWKLYKYLQKLSKDDTEAIQVKEYVLWDGAENISMLQKKYPNIEYNILSHILHLKSWNIEKTISELEKLSIAHESVWLDLVNKNIIPELEQSIFTFIENLLHNRKKQSLNDMRIILEQSEIMSFYYGLLSNMRVIMYILLFLKLKKSKATITQELNLWKRWFLIDKYASLNYKKISTLYTELCELDSNMKSWKLGQFSNKPLEDALQVLILRQ